MRPFPTEITAPHRHAWLWEPLEERSTFERRTMFGCQALYLDGKMIACFATKAEPWRGLLVCTSREHHESLQAEFPALKPHKILGKWLYLAECHASFERSAQEILRLAARGDSRLGVLPGTKKRARKPRPAASSRRNG